MSIANTTPTGETRRPRRPFAATVQLALIFAMIISFIMITQQFDRNIYQWGILALIFFALLQIAFGNIPPHFNFVRSLISVIIAAAIITGLVLLSINLVPTLVNLGR
jgi:hypothetical protein